MCINDAMKQSILFRFAQSAVVNSVVCALMFFIFSSSAHADSNYLCTPDLGHTVVNYNLNDAFNSSQNIAGELIVNRKEIDTNGVERPYTCKCSGYSGSALHYFSSQSQFGYITEDGRRWLKVKPEFVVAAEFFIYQSTGGTDPSGNYHSVPFTGITNNVTEPCNFQGSAVTATRGLISVKLKSRVVGELKYSGEIAKVWHYRRSNYINVSDPYVAAVNLNLDVEVPAKCALRSGSVLTVPFGTLQASQFDGVTYPNPPKNFTPTPFDLAFDCDFSSEILKLKFLGDATESLQAIKVNGDDNLSVVILDDAGDIFPPNVKVRELPVGANMKTPILRFSAYPTAYTRPKSGPFNATAVIQLELR